MNIKESAIYHLPSLHFFVEFAQTRFERNEIAHIFDAFLLQHVVAMNATDHSVEYLNRQSYLSELRAGIEIYLNRRQLHGHTDGIYVPVGTSVDGLEKWGKYDPASQKLKMTPIGKFAFQVLIEKALCIREAHVMHGLEYLSHAEYSAVLNLHSSCTFGLFLPMCNKEAGAQSPAARHYSSKVLKKFVPQTLSAIDTSMIRGSVSDF